MYLHLSFPEFLTLHYSLSFLIYFILFFITPSLIHFSAGIHTHTALSLKNHTLSLSKSQNPSTPSFPSNYYHFIYFFIETHVGCQV